MGSLGTRCAALFSLFALVVAGACGGSSTELSADGYLRVGVDMLAECNGVSASLVDAGLEHVTRVDQPYYCALAAASADGARTAVRIVTRRGIVYSADGERGALPGATPVTLLSPPGGHAGPELLVAREASSLASSGGAGRCIDVVQVDAQGGAQSIPLELDALAAVTPVDDRTCIGEVLDVDGDGTAEAYIVVRAPALTARSGRVPAVRVPLAPSARSFVYVAPPAAHWQRERAARTDLLASALATRDFITAHTLGVELALIARLAGEHAPAQRAAYDASIGGLSIGAERQALVDAVHAAFAGD